jgi:hypothetical protein
VPTWGTFAQLHNAIRIAFAQADNDDWMFEIRDMEHWTTTTSHAQPVLKIAEYSYVRFNRKFASSTTVQDILDDGKYRSKVILYASGSGSAACTYTIYNKGSALSAMASMTSESLRSLERIRIIEGKGKLSPLMPYTILPFEHGEQEEINWQLNQYVVPLPPKDRAEALVAIERR